MTISKQIKRLVSLLLCVALIATMLPMGIFTVNAETTPGTTKISHLAEVPEGYVGIYTKADLDAVRNNLAGKYILMNDIEFTEADFAEGGDFYNNGTGWEPIGTKEAPFTGVFDGNGYTIKNLYINIVESSADYSLDFHAGLLGYIDAGTVKNLGMLDSDITVSASSTSHNIIYAGSIAGHAENGIITNCYNTGAVSVLNTRSRSAGGIVGSVKKGTITNCYNTGDILSSSRNEDSYAGGIAGSSYETTITDCYNTGRINSSTDSQYYSNAYTGGITSYVKDGTITNCYNIGDVFAYAAGSGQPYAGNIAGYINDSSTVTNCYYADIIYKGVAYGTDNCTKCTFEEMQEQETFVGFDFENVWEFKNNGNPLPTLIQNPHIVISENTTEFAGGAGTSWSPYKISDKHHLNNVRNYLNAYFILTSNIEFTEADFAEGGEFYNNGTGWKPIGTEETPFTGVFNGNGYAIKNLYIKIDSNSICYTGLFSHINNSIVENLGMENSEISAHTIANRSSEYKSYAGGIVGYNYKGTIINCYNAGNISASLFYSDASLTYNYPSYAGGIVGYNEIGKVENCYNAGTVNASCSSVGGYLYAYAGGITGYNEKGTIISSYNVGTVDSSAIISGNNARLGTANAYTGGITGYGYNGFIKNTYNSGKINAVATANGFENSYHNYPHSYTFAGGIAGYLDGIKGKGAMTNCYNIGIVNATSLACVERAIHIYAYGLVGSNDAGRITLTNCYYLDIVSKGVGDDSGISVDIDTSVQCDIEAMKLQSTYDGFDFENIWEIGTNEEYPFPTLKGNTHRDINAVENTTEFAGGTGKPWNPYKISTKQHLNNVGKYLNSCFVLLNDIEFNVLDFIEDGNFYNNGAGWEPIGTKEAPFTGIFDGNGYSIKNLYICVEDETTTDAFYVGLFGYFAGGIIKDLGMVDSLIGAKTSGTDYVGGIVGYALSGSITNCYNTGDILYDEYAGGIAGYISSSCRVIGCYNSGNIITESEYAGGIVGYSIGLIRDCYNKGTVTGTYAGGIAGYSTKVGYCYNAGEIVGSCVGGIVGESRNGVKGVGTITHCYNTGTIVTFGISYEEVAGGIVGLIYSGDLICCYNIGIVLAPSAGGIVGDSRGQIYNSYNAGPVIGYFYAGGIVAICYNGNIITCYNTGNVGGVYEDTFVGGIAGFADYITSDTFCYYLDNVSVGIADGEDKTTKCTLEEMQKKETFRAFDFENYWFIDEESDYKLPQIINTPHIKTLSIKITALPNKLTYVEGQEIDVTGLIVEATFENGVTQNVGDVILDYDTSVVGTQTVTVIYGGKTDTFEIVVTSAPSSVTSSKHTVSENTISKIVAGTTVNELLANLNEGEYCKVFKGETEVTGDSAVGTGMTVKIMAGNTAKATYTIIVTGDTNGDGEISITDMIAIKSHILGKSALTDAAEKAADTSGDSEISITDFIQVKAKILGKGEITAR